MKPIRYCYHRNLYALTLCICLSGFIEVFSNGPGYYIEVKPEESLPGRELFNMGKAVNPAGDRIEIDSRSLLINGTPVIPVMGEFHYSRFPEAEWKKELLKMKAGGITIVATYAFWIHHEEVEGVYNWQGQRHLRRFIELCGELDLLLILRIGPWCHGEVRNGGLPEWLVNSGIKLRGSYSSYMEKVETWYKEVYRQAAGLLWTDGGPVIGIQLENEYRGRWEHLMDLKTLAKDIGFDVPLYTRTGWPKLATQAVFGEIIPLYGDYVDGFWDRSLDEMPGDYSKTFLFRSFRNSTVIATEQLPKQSDKNNADEMNYPFFTCELGGGMMSSYHRRISIHPMDIYSLALVKVGSGSNLPGYYMYHGGTNPDGLLTSLNEKQASNMTYHNDLPVKSYDFQAPLGEFGQINPHYHLLRTLHLFLKDFGKELATMPPYFPLTAENAVLNDSTLRWSVRSDGNSGFLFINNYQRLKEMGKKEGVQFRIKLPNSTLTLPSSPITVEANTCFFLPFNLSAGGARLIYSTAQLVTSIDEGRVSTLVFKKNKGIPADFIFDKANLRILPSESKGKKSGEQLCFRDVEPSTGFSIRLQSAEGKILQIILLDEAQALSCWKVPLNGKEYVVLSHADIQYHENRLTWDTKNEGGTSFCIYPRPQSLNTGEGTLTETKEGAFSRFSINEQVSPLPFVQSIKLREAGSLRKIVNGKANVAESPDETDFEQAAAWQLVFSPDVDPQRDLFLSIPYTGDVARVYINGKLVTDHFYNGKELEIGLKRFAPDVYKNGLVIKILPLQKEAPIYIPAPAIPAYGEGNAFLSFPTPVLYEKRAYSVYVQ